MAILTKGTWWREVANTSDPNLIYNGIIVAPNRTVIVGRDVTATVIRTINTPDLNEPSPTVTPRTPGGTGPLWAVAHISAEIQTCAVGTVGHVEQSGDEGISWGGITLPGSPHMYDIVGVTGDPTRFVAVGTNVIFGQSQTSNWTTRWTGSASWSSVAYRAGAGWVVVSFTGSATQSPTALNGSFITPYSITGNVLWKVRANDSYFIAVGTNGSIFRSATGLSGSWTDFSLAAAPTLKAITPLAADTYWVASDTDGRSWYSSDNGATWTINEPITRDFNDLIYAAPYALACGDYGSIYLTYEQNQADFITTATTPAPPPAFSANADMTNDAVRRLIGQFRSSS